ncbi:MAG TPA: CDGSH iron-sulfur domain-containing protein [Candidatus Anoxymicrobiaceae bacterium]
MSPGGKTRKIVITANGPYLVSGAVPLRREVAVPNDEGDPVEWREEEKLEPAEEYSLCRCGQSENKPYCDGSHLRAEFDGTETCDRLKYEEKCRRIPGPELELSDAEEYCAEARFCHPEGGTWHLARHSDDPRNKELAITQACNCPSGRLTVWKDGKPVEPELEPSIGLVEDPAAECSGPLRAKGGIPIESSDGTPYETRNRVTLCRCGHSKNKPLCDGSHRSAHFKA